MDWFAAPGQGQPRISHKTERICGSGDAVPGKDSGLEQLLTPPYVVSIRLVVLRKEFAFRPVQLQYGTLRRIA